MNNTITSNEIQKLFGWFDTEFPDFDAQGEQNTQERWYAYLSPYTEKDLRRGCKACLRLREDSTLPMTVPPNLELFGTLCRTT